MRQFDFTPFRRSTIGFDRLFDLLEASARAQASENYPPFNLERVAEDRYRITIAVAGFKADEIDITAQQNLLLVAGRRREENENNQGAYLHLGIATRSFERRFELADHVKVVNASLVNGLLTIDLKREIPEEMKPRRLEIAAEKAAPKVATKKIEAEKQAA